MTTIVSISDVHIKEQGDPSCRLFDRFLDHEKTQRADVVVFLGDIFDLMVGPYTEYIEKFREVFGKMDALAATKKIYYFQGNHDFHLMDIFLKQDIFKNLHKIEICRYGKVIQVGKRKVYFEHGDDSEIGNNSYKAYKSFVGSHLMTFLVKHIFNFKIVEYIGTRMSRASRIKNEKKYAADSTHDNAVRDRFRESARRVAKRGGCDVVVFGHSHIKDAHGLLGGGVYLNNGYVVTEGCFCLIEEDGEGIVSLGSIPS